MKDDDKAKSPWVCGGNDHDRVTRRRTFRTLIGAAALPAVAGTLYAAQRGNEGKGGTIDPNGKFIPPHRGAVPRSIAQELTDAPVSPEQFGAIGDGTADDTKALQAALDSGRSVRLVQGRDYLLRERLRLAVDGVSISGGGRIRIAPDFRTDTDTVGQHTHMRALFVTGRDVTIDSIAFDATRAPMGNAVENGFIWTTAAYTTVRDCLFIGNRKGSCIWALGNAPYLSVLGCRFRDCSGAVVAKGRNSVISDNIIVNATDAAIAINGQSCIGAVIANNTISNEIGATIPAMIAVEECASDWSITGNVLIGANGGAIACINVLDNAVARGGVIANNVIDGRLVNGQLPTTRNPGAMVSLSSRYQHWVIRGNTIVNPPLGNPNTRLASLPATGGVFEGNLLDATAGVGLSALVEITPGDLGLTIRGNQSRGFAGARHYLFSAGEYANVPCRFLGGSFLVGEEAINAELQATGIHNLRLHIYDIDDCDTSAVVNAPTLLGDRARYLNAGAWRFPHRIGVNTVMFCDELPKDSGRMPFAAGDRLHFLQPSPSGPATIIRVGKGWIRAV